MRGKREEDQKQTEKRLEEEGKPGGG